MEVQISVSVNLVRELDMTSYQGGGLVEGGVHLKNRWWILPFKSMLNDMPSFLIHILSSYIPLVHKRGLIIARKLLIL